MRRLVTIPVRWSNAPAAIVLVVAFLLLAGIGIILQNEAAYRDLQVQETRAQADIVAASVTAALDFGDRQAAQETTRMLLVLRGRSILTVTDARVGPERGMIHFAVVAGRVRFFIDDAEAAGHGLSISSRLLALAVGVRERR